jgi:hypothetical protein
MPQADLDTAWLRFMLNAVLASLTVDPDRSVEDLTVERQAAAAMLGAFQVRNAIEAAFAAQAVAACHAALECFRRAALMNASFPETGRVFATATSLSRMALQTLRAITAGRPAVRPAKVANPLAAVLAAAGQVNPMQSGGPAGVANPSAARPAATGQVNPMQSGTPAKPANPSAATAAAVGELNPMQSGAPTGPANSSTATTAAADERDPARRAPGPRSGGGAPAGAANPLAEAMATFGQLNPMQSGAASLLATAIAELGRNGAMSNGTPTGQPIPASIAGLDLTSEEQEALACFAAAMTQMA